MFGLLKRPYFLRGLVACMLSWGSAFTMFTYLRPFLEQVTGVDVTTLSVLLLVLGCAGFVGTWAAGRFLKGNVAPFLKLPALRDGRLPPLGLLLLGCSPIAAGLLHGDLGRDEHRHVLGDLDDLDVAERRRCAGGRRQPDGRGDPGLDPARRGRRRLAARRHFDPGDLHRQRGSGRRRHRADRRTANVC